MNAHEHHSDYKKAIYTKEYYSDLEKRLTFFRKKVQTLEEAVTKAMFDIANLESANEGLKMANAAYQKEAESQYKLLKEIRLDEEKRKQGYEEAKKEVEENGKELDRLKSLVKSCLRTCCERGHHDEPQNQN